MPGSVFITGTDTGVGKTFASCALLHALRARGLRAVGMKPVASGCERIDDDWRNADALALQAASDPRPAYALVNPFALPEPTAPQIAATQAGVEVCLEPMLAAYQLLQQQADAVVVEGVGGWLAPMADGLEQADLVRALRLPVLLVVGLKLGCLNHARLTARAVLADGLSLRGWIASDVDPALAHAEDYFGLLQAALPMPCIGRLPHRPDGDAAALAGTLRFA
ncbi:MAG TPA: dethiobiotin synthase [Arenimonas sp.]|nr:dethiobiotin synthase [Arenimonas sp.]